MFERGSHALRRWTGLSGNAGATANPGEIHRARRGRRIGASTVAAIAAKVVGISGSFIAIPLTIGYLGVERYGVLVALGALTSMFVFADLGLGNGLLNLISDANGRDDRDAARRAVSSAFVMLICVAVGLAIAFALVYPFVGWSGVLQVRGPLAAAEAGPTAAVLVALFLAAIPMGLVERIRLGYQEGFINSLASIAGGLLGLAGLVIAVALNAGLPILVLATSAPPVLALAINGIDLFRTRRPWLRPRWRLADRVVSTRLARVGALFLVLQLAVAVAYQSDVVVAAAIFGPAAAATYSVTLKFFMLAPVFIALFLTTLWPAYTEAIARNDVVWVMRTFRRSVVVAAVGAGMAAMILVVGGAWLIRAWTRGAVDPPFELLVGAAIWSIIYAAFNAVAILLNAMSIVAFQVVAAVVMAIASIGLSIVFANRFGISGIVWGTLVAYVLCSAIPTCIFLPRLFGRLRQMAHAPGSGVGSA